MNKTTITKFQNKWQVPMTTWKYVGKGTCSKTLGMPYMLSKMKAKQSTAVYLKENMNQTR